MFTHTHPHSLTQHTSSRQKPLTDIFTNANLKTQNTKTCLWIYGRILFGLQRLWKHMRTHREMLPGCRQCQWGLKMRIDHDTLYSGNGQADGRLLCSLCLGWWLYSSDYSASLQPRVGLRFIELSSPHMPLCYSVALLFICTFYFSLHIFYFLSFCRGLHLLHNIKGYFIPARRYGSGGNKLLAHFGHTNPFLFNFTCYWVKACLLQDAIYLGVKKGILRVWFCVLERKLWMNLSSQQLFILARRA